MGTSEAICKFNPRTESFTRLERNETNPFTFNMPNHLKKIKKSIFGSPFPLAPSFLNNPAPSPILVMCEDRQGIFWLGTDNGILSFDRKTGRTVSYPYDPNHPERISDYWALAINEDSDGNLWIGPGSQAVTRFNPKTGTFTQYRHGSHNPGSISSNTVPSICEDTNGNLWFGTEEGLCRFDYATENFTTYSEQQGLGGNVIFSIFEDNEGDLWMGTNNGLSKFWSYKVRTAFISGSPTSAMQWVIRKQINFGNSLRTQLSILSLMKNL